jgi:hypothetical protein
MINPAHSSLTRPFLPVFNPRTKCANCDAHHSFVKCIELGYWAQRG